MKAYEIPAYQLVMLETADVITASVEEDDGGFDTDWM